MTNRVKLFKRPKDGKDWPFIVDEIAVIKPYLNCVAVALINNDGHEVFLALNGYAKMLCKLENVHDAGYAESGKSTTRFIEAGLLLEPITASNDFKEVVEVYNNARKKALIRYSNELYP